jgi:translocator assembly and maintenance protein 41
MIPRARVSIFVSSNSLRCFNPPLIRHFSTPPRPPSDKDQSPEPIQFPKYNVKTYGADVKKFSQLPVNFGANQHISIDDQLKEKLRSVLWKFNAPIRYAFAYGSGVFQQANADPKDVISFALGFVNGKMPMVDFIFGVSHTQHWHGLNLVQNPHHYSGMRYLGSGAISWVQDDSGAGVYFNPYVEVGGLTIKYGVVNIETLCRDLLEWDTLYLAGRLQKPVLLIYSALTIGKNITR